MRNSITSTYDSRKTGPRYSLTSYVNNKPVWTQKIHDPFVNHSIEIRWYDILKSLLYFKKLVVAFRVDGDSEIIEDVLELDENYLGTNCTRRQEFRAIIENKLSIM